MRPPRSRFESGGAQGSLSPRLPFVGILLWALTLAVTVDAKSFVPCQQTPFNTYAYCNYSLPVDVRVADLVSRMTLDQKASWMGTYTPAIPELGLPEYSYWSECLHGVMSVNHSTSFPEPIGLGATFNMSLISEMASFISTEARALNNLDAVFFPGQSLVGLTFFAPNINIFRDPRWGRGQETPGEDPYLTGRYVAAFSTGLQKGEDPRYLKVISTCKHYAAYSLELWNGVDRYHFNANVSLADLAETYLPAFDACINVAGARSVMCSYNAVDGAPSCANDYLLTTVLRDAWGFDGHVTGDCGAVECIQTTHNYTSTTAETCNVALAAGTDLDCGSYYQSYVASAVQSGVLSEALVNQSMTRVFRNLMMLGMFDPPEMVVYQSIGNDSLNTPAAQELALEAAREAIVLLKNDKNLLPLDLTSIKNVAVIGPNADSPMTLLGNYYGNPPFIVTPLEALSNTEGINVMYSMGCEILGDDTSEISNAVNIASQADVALLFVGLNQSVEAEMLDRYNLTLPGVQLELVQQVYKTGVPTVVIFINGGPVGEPWIKDNVPAIVEAWYGGMQAGNAIADVLFGRYNPGGRLPVTIYYDNYTTEISMLDMNMKPYPGRTYRYLQVPVLWPFGFGLSYTTFNITFVNGPPSIEMFDSIAFSAVIKNTGNVAGSESVLAFFTANDDPNGPLKQLFGFERVFLQPGESTQVYFTLPPVAMAFANEKGEEVLTPGRFTVTIGDATTSFVVRGDQPTKLPKELSLGVAYQ